MHDKLIKAGQALLAEIDLLKGEGQHNGHEWEAKAFAVALVRCLGQAKKAREEEAKLLAAGAAPPPEAKVLKSKGLSPES